MTCPRTNFEPLLLWNAISLNTFVSQTKKWPIGQWHMESKRRRAVVTLLFETNVKLKDPRPLTHICQKHQKTTFGSTNIQIRDGGVDHDFVLISNKILNIYREFEYGMNLEKPNNMDQIKMNVTGKKKGIV